MTHSAIKQKLAPLLKRTGLYNFARWLAGEAWPALYTFYCVVTNRRAHRFARYQQDHAVAKLHLGCGFSYLPGWFNTDLAAGRCREHLNAVRPYPFPDNSFDYIFTEHMIEHVPYAAGRAMLSECFRVLKPGGVLRLVTPDLKFLIALCQDPSPVRESYVKWSSENFLNPGVPHHAISVVNNFFYSWGHCYIYDTQTMKDLLSEIGFVELTDCRIGQSRHVDLSGLENESRMPEGFLALESMVLEAQKPNNAA